MWTPRLESGRLRQRLVTVMTATALAVTSSVSAGPLDFLWLRGGHRGGCQGTIFLDQNTMLSLGNYDPSYLINTTDGKMIRSLPTMDANLNAIARSPDGKLMAIGEGYDANVYRVSDGAEIAHLTGHFSLLADLDFSRDGQWLVTAGSFDGQVGLWRTSDWGQERLAPLSMSGAPMTVAFSADGGSYYTGHYLGDINEWSTADGSYIRTLAGHTGGVWTIELSQDGQYLLSGSADGTIRRWDLSTGLTAETYTGHTDEVECVAFAPGDQAFVSASLDQTLKTWQVGVTTAQHTFTGHTDGVLTADYSPDGSQIVSGGDYNDSQVRLWDSTSGQFIRKLTTHTELVQALAISSNGAIVASSAGASDVYLWDGTNGDLLGTIPAPHPNETYDLDMSPDGSMLVTGGDGAQIKLWSLNTLGLIRTFPGHFNYVMRVAFSPDGTMIASAGEDDLIKVWRVSDGALIRSMGEGSTTYQALAFSPDSATLAFKGTTDTIQLRRISDGQLLQTLTGPTNWVSEIDFSPDGQIVVAGCADGRVRWWRAADGALLQTTATSTGIIPTVAFGPEGRTVIAGGWQSHSLSVWRASDAALLRTYADEGGDGVWRLRVSGNGKRVALGRYDPVVGVMRLPPACGGDVNADGVVDRADYVDFASCMAGPEVTTPPPGCDAASFERADLYGDGDVDLDDYAVLAAVMEN